MAAVRNLAQSLLPSSVRNSWPIGGSKLSEASATKEDSSERMNSDAAASTLKEVSSHNYVTLGEPIGEGGFSSVYLARKKRPFFPAKIRAAWRRKSDGAAEVESKQPSLFAVKICELNAENTKVDPEELRLLSPPEAVLVQNNQVHVSTLEDIEEELSFLRELRGNKNIVRLEEAFVYTKPEQCWIVTEALSVDFSRVVQTHVFKEAKFRPARYVVLVEVCEALIFLKSKRIIHGDIKPSNILLSATGNVKLCDFGIARRIPADMEYLVAQAAERGSPNYMAPEILVPGKHYDYSIDLWAFGMLVYASFNAGRTLFAKRNRGVSIHLRSPCSFESRDWRCWKRHPIWYLYYFMGGFALNGQEHARLIELEWERVKGSIGYKQGTYSPSEQQLKAWEDARVRGTNENGRLRRYVAVLRMCLIPLAGTSPLGDPERWPENIRRGTIEAVLECELWSLRPASELEQRNAVVELVKFVSSQPKEMPV